MGFFDDLGKMAEREMRKHGPNVAKFVTDAVGGQDGQLSLYRPSLSPNPLRSSSVVVVPLRRFFTPVAVLLIADLNAT